MFANGNMETECTGATRKLCQYNMIERFMCTKANAHVFAVLFHASVPSPGGKAIDDNNKILTVYNNEIAAYI